MKNNITFAAKPSMLALSLVAVVFGIGALAVFIYVSSSNASIAADSYLQEAVDALKNANRAEHESRKVMIEASHTRKEVKKIRAELRKLDHAKTEELTQWATALTERLAQLQERGARLRASSLELKQWALRLFEQGFYRKWKPWVGSRAPLTMAYSNAPTMAHNTQIRSTHPRMVNNMGTAADSVQGKIETSGNMTLRVPALAPQNTPEDLDTRVLQLSRDEYFLAHIEVQTSSAFGEHKNPAAVPLNKMHKWRLLISDLAGNPVRHAKIGLDGHMPGHVHGLPSQPEVTAEIAPGVYLVEGIKFQMKGWWVMQFHVTAAGVNVKPDTLTFNLVL